MAAASEAATLFIQGQKPVWGRSTSRWGENIQEEPRRLGIWAHQTNDTMDASIVDNTQLHSLLVYMLFSQTWKFNSPSFTFSCSKTKADKSRVWFVRFLELMHWPVNQSMHLWSFWLSQNGELKLAKILNARKCEMSCLYFQLISLKWGKNEFNQKTPRSFPVMQSSLPRIRTTYLA